MVCHTSPRRLSLLPDASKDRRMLIRNYVPVKTAVGGAAGVMHQVDSATTDCQPNENVEALRMFMLGKKIEARPTPTFGLAFCRFIGCNFVIRARLPFVILNYYFSLYKDFTYIFCSFENKA